MPTISFPGVNAGMSTEELADLVARLLKEIQWLLNGNIDSLNIKKLTADLIVAGTVLANLVTIQSNLDGGAFITIDGTGMTVNDGTQDVLKVDTNGNITMIGTLDASVVNGSEINGGTITGALIQTDEAGNYPRIQLDSSNNLLSAEYSATNTLKITPTISSSSPGIQLINDLVSALIGNTSTGKFAIVTVNGEGDIQLSSGEDLELFANNTIRLIGSGLTMNNVSGYTGSFSTGTQTVIVSNGIITNVV